MTRVLAEVFCAVNDVALASKVVDTVGNALGIDILLGACPKILLVLHAEGVFDAGLEHFARLLAEDGVLIVVRLKIFLPGIFDKRGHAFIIV